MERSFMKKTMNIFFCALLGAAVLIGGCSDNNKACLLYTSDAADE